MPYRTEILNEGTVLLRTWWGDVVGQDVIDAAATLVPANVDPAEIKYLIVDLTGVDTYNVSGEDVTRIIALHERAMEYLDIIKVAIVASSDIAYGMSRVYGARISVHNWEVYSTRTMAEAIGWLGIGFLQKPSVGILDPQRQKP